MNKKRFFLLAIGVIIGIFIFFYEIEPKNTQIELKTVKFGEKILNIEIADSDLERIRGLSGRDSLGEGEGVLFVFENPGFHGIWMKEMNFPIDIAWLNGGKEIIHIERSVSPGTYPRVFGAGFESMYVIEVSARFFENSNIKIGDAAEF